MPSSTAFASRRRVKSRAGRIAFVCFALVSDLMPAFILLFYRLLPDNPTPAVKAAMWLMFVYLLTLLPRLAYYLVSLLGRRPAVRLVAMAAALGCVALLVWGAVRGRRAIVVNRVTIASDRLPEAFRGLRIVQFSDTHIGSMVNSRRELRALVDTINGLRPDLVVFSGDLVNIRYTELDQPAREILGAIRAPFGSSRPSATTTWEYTSRIRCASAGGQYRATDRTAAGNGVEYAAGLDRLPA